MFQKAIGRLLGKPEIQFPLETVVSETRVLLAPKVLRISLCQGGGDQLTSSVAAKDEVTPGQVLATGAGGFTLTSPTAGTVQAVTGVPDIRGDRKGRAILVEPSDPGKGGAYEALDPETSTRDELTQRIVQAGILASKRTPVPLHSELCPEGDGVNTLVVLAADCDPGVSVALHLLRTRAADAGRAAKLLGRIAAAKRVVVALLGTEKQSFPSIEGVEVLGLPVEYPATLPEVVQRRLDLDPGAGDSVVVALETALATLDAVSEGKAQSEKLVTLIGPDQEPIANYRVQLGTPILDILEDAGIKAKDQDKVIAGGPMRGFALYSLLGSIDAGVDALTVIPNGKFPAWSPEPCINCGQCIDICPINLQTQLIARFAEFELFDRTEELDIKSCFECGLCASVCTGRRPLLQYIRLAKEGLEGSA